jgi:hypothetical protein
MQIPDDMFQVEVQYADEICIGDFITGSWNDIYVETFTHATSIGEVRALDFSLATLEDLHKLSSTELGELQKDSYILVKGVYRLRVPPPEVRGTVIDILEFRFASSEISVPQRAIWTDGNRWATDTSTTAKSSDIQRWNLVAAAHKPR